MSRFLVVGIIVFLIIGIVGGATVLVLQRLRDQSEQAPQPAEEFGQLQEAEPGSPQIVESADDDNDGLPNTEETRWGSNPTNPDTDGDGYLDGEEIAARHNPIVPAPNDLLPAGAVPPPAAPAIVPGPLTNVDQYFAEGLDLTLGTKDFSEEYRSRYRPEERTQETLIAYAQEQPVTTQLPSIANKPIQQSTSNTPATLQDYLAAVGSLDVFYPRLSFLEAVSRLYNSGDPGGIRSLALTVRLYQSSLLNAQVPLSAEPLHKLLLGYTELLSATYDQMARYSDDPVRSVIAMRQLEEIDRKYFPLLSDEVARLQALQ